MKKTKVAILGTGNIGTDLLIKVLRSDKLTCTAFVGRSLSSQGIYKAQSLGVNVSADGITYLQKNPDVYDIVFDATSAASHFIHAPILAELNKSVIDLTPAKVGEICVPSVNLKECLDKKNLNMVTCGGQASIPIAYAISQTQKNIEYIEVVSAIASKSAGPATRLNLDEYIHTTELGIKKFCNVKKVKAILNLNPAVPCINMQTTVMAKVENPDLESLKSFLIKQVELVKTYVPGYEIIVGPVFENGRIIVSVRVKGLGDFLPSYAGNLDIINCAAIAAAEKYAEIHA